MGHHFGAGMVHPKVFLEFGYDPAEVSGIALAWEQRAWLLNGWTKVKSLYDQSLAVLHDSHRPEEAR